MERNKDHRERRGAHTVAPKNLANGPFPGELRSREGQAGSSPAFAAPECLSRNVCRGCPSSPHSPPAQSRLQTNPWSLSPHQLPQAPQGPFIGGGGGWGRREARREVGVVLSVNQQRTVQG